LLEREGLFKPRRVLEELAGEIPYFAAAAQPVGPLGIDLKAGAAAPATV
jgi:hypothetical protein